MKALEAHDTPLGERRSLSSKHGRGLLLPCHDWNLPSDRGILSVSQMKVKKRLAFPWDRRCINVHGASSGTVKTLVKTFTIEVGKPL